MGVSPSSFRHRTSMLGVMVAMAAMTQGPLHAAEIDSRSAPEGASAAASSVAPTDAAGWRQASERQFARGELAAAAESARRAVQLADSRQAAEESLSARLAWGRALTWSGDGPAARRTLQDAVTLAATRGAGGLAQLRALIAWCRNGLDGGFVDFQTECRGPALQALSRASDGSSSAASFLYLLLAEVGIARREAAAASWLTEAMRRHPGTPVDADEELGFQLMLDRVSRETGDVRGAYASTERKARRADASDDERGQAWLQVGQWRLRDREAPAAIAALALADTALSAAYGPMNLQAMRARTLLSEAYALSGDLPRAVALRKSLLSQTIRQRGEDHVVVATERARLARMVATTDPAEAVALYDAAMPGLERAFGPASGMLLNERASQFEVQLAARRVDLMMTTLGKLDTMKPVRLASIGPVADAARRLLAAGQREPARRFSEHALRWMADSPGGARAPDGVHVLSMLHEVATSLEDRTLLAEIQEVRRRYGVVDGEPPKAN